MTPNVLPAWEARGTPRSRTMGGGAGRGFETGNYMALSSPTSQPLVIDGVSYPSDPLEVKKVGIPSRAGWGGVGVGTKQQVQSQS